MTPDEMLALLRAVAQRDQYAAQVVALRQEVERLTALVPEERPATAPES